MNEGALHGREVAIAALRGALTNALEGRGGLVLLSGEAGIGKTTLAAAIAREAEVRGALVTWGRAWEFADAPPYFPVWPCLRALGLATTAHDEHDTFQLWESVITSLAAASGAVVWVLEDLHAADLGTLDLLTFLARPLHALRVLVVATVRAKDPRLTDRMTQRLARMTRDGSELRLEPLAELDVAALTEETVGRPLPAAVLRRLVDLTGGNPLFVVECARAFRSGGAIEGTLAALPPTVRQVVLERVTLLPEATRHALAAGAIVGREFSAATVARMDQSLPARVIDALLPALRSGVLEETRPGNFVFSHALVRDAIADALGTDERAALHGKAAAALAASGDSADVLVERARHAIAALLASSDGDGALALAKRATDLLEREGAFDRAFELCLRTRDAEEAGLLPPASAVEKLHVARIARAAGRSDATQRICEEVIASARQAGDAELFARAILLHALDVRPGIIDRPQLLLLEEARGLLGDRAPELGCRLLARVATALQPAADPFGPMEMTKEAIERARATGDEPALLDVLELSGWGAWCAPTAQRIAWSTELFDRALASGALPKAMTAYTSLVFFHLEAGDFGAFDRTIDAMLALSDEIGHPRHRWRALLLASGRAMMHGFFAESDRYLAEVTELAPLVDDPSFARAVAAHEDMRAKLQRRDDDRRGIDALALTLAPVPRGDVVIAILRASRCARSGDREGARRELANAGTGAASIVGDTLLGPFLAEAYALAGTDAERRQSRAALEARPDVVEIVGDQFSFTYEGPMSRVLGLLDASLGDRASAETRLRDARDRAIARRHLPWQAQIARELGNVVGGGEGTALLEESARIARDLGMPGLTRANEERRPSTRVPAIAVTMQRDGKAWKITRGASVAIVIDSRGMQLLARLVARPGEEIHVLALASDEAVSAPETSAGEMLDERARTAYRERLSELDERILEGERHGDARAVAKLEKEKDAIVTELKRAVGLGGRVRRAGSATERARVNVQRRVKDAIARIGQVDEVLGRFFETNVTTGTFCSFRST